MVNPLQIEKAYAQLVNDLNSSLSYRQKWILARNFLQLISNDFSSRDTYCLQVIPQLPVINEPLSITGCDPAFFEEVLNLLIKCSEEVPELQNDETFQEVKTSIECSLIFLHNCLNQPEVGLQRIDGNFSPNSYIGDEYNNLTFLDSYRQYYRGNNGDLVECLNKVKRWWQNIEKNTQSIVYVPVVEEETGTGDGGRLRALHSRVIGRRTDHDLYESYYAVFGAEKGENNISQHLASNVRPVVNQSYSRLGDTYFHVQFSYRFKHGVEIGRSSELALGISAFCCISNSLKDRYFFNPASYTALTGIINNQGRITPVDSRSIRCKVEAAFFSWISTLVVPNSQKQEFERVVGELQKKYPSKSLTIIGIDRFEDVIYDRRITQKNIQSRTRFYLKKAWQKKFSVTGLLTILILLAIIGAMWYGPINKNPVRGEFRATDLIVYNSNGTSLARLETDYRSVNTRKRNGSESSEPQVQFMDITGDGVNEVFYSKYPYSGWSPKSTIAAWSLSGDSLIWNYTLDFEVDFPKKHSIVDDRFLLREFYMERVDGEILIVGNSDLNALFPSVVFTLDAREGTIKQRYVHPGHFYAMELKDLNTDGVREAVLTGVNNAYWQAVITALDLEDLQGHGPTKGDYVINGYSRADERHYVMVPKTVVGKYYEPIQKSNRGLRIREKSGDDLIYFEILDAPYQDFEGMNLPPYIILYMDNQFKPVGIGTSDLYDIMARDLYQQKKIPFLPDYEYFEAFKDSLLYWNGKTFINRSKMNH